MRRIDFQHGLWTILAVALLAFTLVSCDNISKNRVCKHWSVEHTHPFPNTNWAFEEEVLDFSFDIVDITKYYDVSLKLLFDTTVVTLKDIPLSLTLTTPDGMQAMSASHFLLSKSENPEIKATGEGKNAETSVVVFPRRKFKVPGTYKLTVYRRAEKADNYGFINLSAKMAVVK